MFKETAVLLDQGDHLLLPVPELFSFRENLSYLGRASQESLYVVREHEVWRVVELGGQVVLLRIRESKDEQALRVDFAGPGPHPDAEGRAAAGRYVRHWLDMDTDLAPFYTMADADPLLHEPVRRFAGLRVVGIPDLFEAMSWGIIGQQINLPFAYTLKSRFVEQYGSHIDWQGQTYRLFPTPERVAGLTVDELRPLQMSVRKSEYLIGVARLIASGALSREGLLAEGELQQIEQALVKIRGIGPWTAHYVIMRCLRLPAAFPIADVGLHLALKQALGWDRKPVVPEIKELAAGWAGWEAYATFYLWRTLY
ncbi:DNA-3-methyladenine glycosylase family protein [Paenibacillus sp. 1P07SE]|uniref:DNA-3-methyladenine glycosylase family protein n=1 Tax=Paenibacillus sp. 1P07SE TaxID=3132209 RepID=UPI0039A5E2E0